jgi:hypothetical protein
LQLGGLALREEQKIKKQKSSRDPGHQGVWEAQAKKENKEER